MKKLILILGAALAFTACAPTSTTPSQDASIAAAKPAKPVVAAEINPENLKTAVFAGGCFWCVESDFEKLDGVYEAVSGYTGGTTKNPSYKAVTFTETGHFEAVEVSYDPNIISYTELLDYYWRTIDPIDPNGQFCDQGSSYRTAIFANEEQIKIAEQSKNDIAVSKPFDGPVTTDIIALGTFYVAEDYHQDYYKKNPIHYARYRIGCRRDARLQALWGKAESNSGTYGSGK